MTDPTPNVHRPTFLLVDGSSYLYRAFFAGGESMSVTLADGTVQSVSPCGACRQLIAESGPHSSVGFFGADQHWIIASIAELLPYAFVLPET